MFFFTQWRPEDEAHAAHGEDADVPRPRVAHLGPRGCPNRTD